MTWYARFKRHTNAKCVMNYLFFLANTFSSVLTYASYDTIALHSYHCNVHYNGKIVCKNQAEIAYQNV